MRKKAGQWQWAFQHKFSVRTCEHRHLVLLPFPEVPQEQPHISLHVPRRQTTAVSWGPPPQQS